MAPRLSTGIEVLDRQLEGGVPAGHLVAFSSPPGVQSELLIESVVNEQPTLFLSTVRPASELRTHLSESAVDLTDVKISRVTPRGLASDPYGVLQAVPESGALILDRMNGLEQLNRDAQLSILDAIKSHLVDNGSVGVVHCIGDGDPDARGLTLSRSDIVWQLRWTVTTQSVENTLVVSKFRGGRALTEPIKLRLTDQVSVDTSRDIA